MTKKILSAAVLLALGGTASASGNSLAVDLALGPIQNHRAELRASASDQFVVRDLFVDSVTGFSVAHVDRTYQGLPVIGGDTVERFRGYEFRGADQTLVTTTRPDSHPVIGADQAIINAGAHFGTGFNGMPTARLVIYALHGNPVLAYEVVFSGTRTDQTPTDMHYFVNAKDGRILDKWDTIETTSAAGTGRTLYSGNVPLTTNAVTVGFELLDPSRGGNKTIDGHTGRTSGQIYKDSDNSWGNSTVSDVASAAADAQFGVATTWDFYKNVVGRIGIANNGKGSYNRVHYGVKYNNAFWSDGCFCMTFGDGDGVHLGPLVSLDITGHEMSHGVTARTADLAYSGESGGLNEANSDIMGSMVEFYANNASDTGDYLIGEKIYAGNVSGSPDQQALRYMFNPSRDGTSPNCYYTGIGDLDVHYSSGVANHFFYLLAEGTGAKTYSGVVHTSPTCNGSTFAGIGRTKATQIWYRALTMYMTSGTTYTGAASATVSAAADLYGNTSTERSAVIAAWHAVSVPVN
jgi:Zn-dependent metalloprotease